MKAILTCGISASGKTTWAEEYRKDTNIMNINRDDIRFHLYCNGVRDWSLYKFTEEREKKVTEHQYSQIEAASALGVDVIISDTNINPKTTQSLTNYLKSKGYEVEIKWFDIDLIEALERDAKRPNGVGYKVITDQYRRYMKLRHESSYHTHSNKKKNAIIVDIDGTVASHEGVRSPYEWDKVGFDKPRKHVIGFVQDAEANGYDIIFMSGRDACCMKETRQWLNEYTGITDAWLFMRSAGDMRKDTIVKKELFMKYVDKRFNVQYVIDDRKYVLRMWEYELGLTVIDVGQQHHEF